MDYQGFVYILIGFITFITLFYKLNSFVINFFFVSTYYKWKLNIRGKGKIYISFDDKQVKIAKANGYIYEDKINYLEKENRKLNFELKVNKLSNDVLKNKLDLISKNASEINFLKEAENTNYSFLLKYKFADIKKTKLTKKMFFKNKYKLTINLVGSAYLSFYDIEINDFNNLIYQMESNKFMNLNVTNDNNALEKTTSKMVNTTVEKMKKVESKLSEQNIKDEWHFIDETNLLGFEIANKIFNNIIYPKNNFPKICFLINPWREDIYIILNRNLENKDFSFAKDFAKLNYSLDPQLFIFKISNNLLSKFTINKFDNKIISNLALLNNNIVSYKKSNKISKNSTQLFKEVDFLSSEFNGIIKNKNLFTNENFAKNSKEFVDILINKKVNGLEESKILNLIYYYLNFEAKKDYSKALIRKYFDLSCDYNFEKQDFKKSKNIEEEYFQRLIIEKNIKNNNAFVPWKEEILSKYPNHLDKSLSVAKLIENFKKQNFLVDIKADYIALFASIDYWYRKEKNKSKFEIYTFGYNGYDFKKYELLNDNSKEFMIFIEEDLQQIELTATQNENVDLEL